MTTFAQTYLDQLHATLETIGLTEVEQAIHWIAQARDAGQQIFVCGNGGSASTASHLATDLVKGASYGRRYRFRVRALTDSLATIMACDGEADYDSVFVDQLKYFARPGDLAIAISGSGNSPNVLKAIEYANSIGCRTLALTGRDGGKLGSLAQLNIRVREPHMGRIEDAHLAICHMLAYYFMESSDDSEPPDSVR